MVDRYSSTVQVLIWFTLVTSVLGVGARSLTKAIIVRSLNYDDYLISISLLFAIGQSVAVSIQAGHGYGDPSVPLTQSELDIVLKTEFAAALLYIASLCFAKASVLGLLKTLTPVRKDRQYIYGLAIFIVLWAVTAEFATALMCHLPKPWDYLDGHCHDHVTRHRWWNYFEITNILTDLALLILPLHVIWTIRISRSKKASVFSFFALRSLVIAASTCKLVLWNKGQRTQQPGLDAWTVTICTQIIQCLSILTACFLYLKPFLDSVESGFIRSDDIRRRGTSEYYGHNRSGSSAVKSDFSIRKPRRTGSDTIKLNDMSSGHNATFVTAGEPMDGGDVESQGSRSHIIKQTKTFAVEDTT